MIRPRLQALALTAASLLLAGSLYLVWRLPGGFTVSLDGGVRNKVDFPLPNENGWERWAVLDIALAVLALGLLATAVVPRRAIAAVAAAGTLAAAAAVLIGAFSRPERSDTFAQTAAGLQLSAGPGPYVALAALALALLALSPLLRRPRAPTL